MHVKSDPRQPLELTTERLHVRPPKQTDLHQLHRVLGDDRTMRYIGDGTGRSLDRVQLALDWSMNLYASRGLGGFIVEHKDTSEVIGDALLVPILHSGVAPKDPITGAIDSSDLSLRGPHIEIGYRLHPDAWGQGYATEAAAALFEYATRPTARGGLGLEYLVGVTHPDNIPSQRVLEKVGLTHQGLSDLYYDQQTMLFTWQRPKSRSAGAG